MYQRQNETSFVVGIGDNAVRFSTRLEKTFFWTFLMDYYVPRHFHRNEKKQKLNFVKFQFLFFFISMKVSGNIIVHQKSREKVFPDPRTKSYCVICNTHHK